VRLPARLLRIGDAPPVWEALGFAVDASGALALGGLRVELTGEGGGIRGVGVEGLRAAAPDGLPIGAGAPGAPAPDCHPIGAIAVDHLVAFTGSLERTVAALVAAGLDHRPDGRGQTPLARAFFNLGTTILELAQGDDPPRFWGLTVVVEDLDAAAERLDARLGTPRDAVQPGRRIATLRRDAGLGLAMALITPRVRTRDRLDNRRRVR
jgi:hypothetical protein